MVHLDKYWALALFPPTLGVTEVRGINSVYLWRRDFLYISHDYWILDNEKRRRVWTNSIMWYIGWPSTRIVGTRSQWPSNCTWEQMFAIRTSNWNKMKIIRFVPCVTQNYWCRFQIHESCKSNIRNILSRRAEEKDKLPKTAFNTMFRQPLMTIWNFTFVWSKVRNTLAGSPGQRILSAHRNYDFLLVHAVVLYTYVLKLRN